MKSPEIQGLTVKATTTTQAVTTHWEHVIDWKSFPTENMTESNTYIRLHLRDLLHNSQFPQEIKNGTCFWVQAVLLVVPQWLSKVSINGDCLLQRTSVYISETNSAPLSLSLSLSITRLDVRSSPQAPPCSKLMPAPLWQHSMNPHPANTAHVREWKFCSSWGCDLAFLISHIMLVTVKWCKSWCLVISFY